jgi:hypothetical protein
MSKRVQTRFRKNLDRIDDDSLVRDDDVSSADVLAAAAATTAGSATLVTGRCLTSLGGRRRPLRAGFEVVVVVVTSDVLDDFFDLSAIRVSF